MIPSATLIPEVIPTGMVAAAVETGLVAAALMVLAGLLGLCIAIATSRRRGAEQVRTASLHRFARPTTRTAGEARAA